MSDLVVVPAVSSVNIKGLQDLNLPFKSVVIGDNTAFDTGFHIPVAGIDDRIYVKSITGLEPPERTISISSTASGGQFQGAITEDREIVVLLGLNPDYSKGETPQTLRNELEAMLTPGYDPKVDIQLMTALFPFAHEYGYVTKFEADIFAKDPVVQITFGMLNPTFRAYEQTTYAASDLSETAPDVFNYGSWETGFQFSVKFTDTMSGWWIKQADHQDINMTFDMTFHTDDILSVSTIPGQKYVHFKPHRGKVQNKLGILKSGSEWIQLHPGHNHFLVPKKTSGWDWRGKLAFTVQYGGI